MLMSMLSSFEALWADSYIQTMKLTAAPTSTEQAQSKKVSSLEGNKKETDSNKNLSSTAPAKKLPQQQILKPRFAPELDGVYCFETIIPY